MPCSKPTVISRGLAGADPGERPDVLGRSGPGILHLAALDGPSPEVVVDRVRLPLGGLDGDVEAGGVLDRVRPGHPPCAHRRHHLEVGGQGTGGHLEAHLVVALAGAAVGHGVGPAAAGDVDQVAHDDGTRQSGHEGVSLLVEGVGAQGRADEVAGELVAAVDDHRVARAGGDGTGLQRFPVAVLAEVARHRDHLDAELLDHPAHGDGRVETAAVGQDDSLGHGTPLRLAERRVRRRAD